VASGPHCAELRAIEQANLREAGARRFSDQRGRRKFEGRQVGKAEHHACYPPSLN
jgi:hypothetical protein